MKLVSRIPVSEPWVPAFGLTLTQTARNTMLDALTALLNSGSVQFQTAGSVAVATCPFGATAFAPASSGSAAANAVTDDTNAVGGTISKAILRNSSGTEMFQGTVTTTGGGGDFQGAAVAIAAGETVSISSYTLTMPAS